MKSSVARPTSLGHEPPPVSLISGVVPPHEQSATVKGEERLSPKSPIRLNANDAS